MWKTKVDSQNLMSTVNNDNITLIAYPIEAQNNRVDWSFGVTQQLGTSSANKHDRYFGTVCSIDLVSGKLLWIKQLEDRGMFYGFSSGLVVNKGFLYLNENNALWVFDASIGTMEKNQNFNHYILPPVVGGNRVFVVSDLQLTVYGLH